jgi:hypothetical protein
VTKHEGPRPGDWLVIEQTHAALVGYPLPNYPPARRLAPADWLPLRTQFCYYSCGTPVEHRDGPRFTVGIYRVPGAVAPGPDGNYSDSKDGK